MSLAQQLIRSDKTGAMDTFGVNEELVDLVAGLSPSQLLKMSASNMLLCCFQFDERVMLNMLTNYKKNNLLTTVATSQAKSKREAIAA